MDKPPSSEPRDSEIAEKYAREIKNLVHECHMRNPNFDDSWDAPIAAVILRAIKDSRQPCSDCAANDRDWKLIADELGSDTSREDMLKKIRSLREVD